MTDDEAHDDPPAARANRKQLVALAVAAVAVVVIGVFVVTRDDGSGPSSGEALRACQTTVREKLKAPATARFDADKPPSVESNAGSSAEPGSMVVNGTVDAENGFGALVRNEYFCIVKLVEGKFVAAADDVILL